MNFKRFACAIIVVGLLSVISAIAAPPPGAPTIKDPEATQGLTPEAVERAKRGEIVIVKAEGGGQALIQVAMLFDVPIQEAYRILRQTDKQCEYLESCDENILIERTADHDVVEFHVKILAWTLKYWVRHQWDDKKYRTWWSLDPKFKSDLKHLEGYWRLYYVDDNHTFARYGTRLIFKDFIPKSIQDSLTRRDLPKSLEAVRKRINSHGTYKKKGA